MDECSECHGVKWLVRADESTGRINTFIGSCPACNLWGQEPPPIVSRAELDERIAKLKDEWRKTHGKGSPGNLPNP